MTIYLTPPVTKSGELDKKWSTERGERYSLLHQARYLCFIALLLFFNHITFMTRQLFFSDISTLIITIQSRGFVGADLTEIL